MLPVTATAAAGVGPDRPPDIYNAGPRRFGFDDAMIDE
jgi:hypothetical protein